MPRCPPEAGQRLLHGGRRAADHRRDLGAGLEQPGGLAVDHLQVALLGGARIARIHELQHFALGDDVGRLGHDLDDALRAHRGHHLEGARVDEIADQHAGLVAEHFVGRVAPAAQGRHIHHVVVQQGRRVDELDERRRLDVWVARRPSPAPQARPASTTSRGRRRLPPPAMMCSATWSTRGTMLLRPARMASSTAARSGRTRSRIDRARGRARPGICANGTPGGWLCFQLPETLFNSLFLLQKSGLTAVGGA